MDIFEHPHIKEIINTVLKYLQYKKGNIVEFDLLICDDFIQLLKESNMIYKKVVYL